ncbi:PDZ domain-containing protein 8 [Ambystoma mexicanum]|uniref:PDZ domain-containing protein 8 n=1 Tax=Ambystoma mexicanum TaxID=8296 RepID=UPI0037E90F24
MYPALLVLLSVLAGSLLTLLLQCLLLYRRKPEPKPRAGGSPGRAGVPGPLLRTYLQGPGEPDAGKAQPEQGEGQCNHKEAPEAGDAPVPKHPAAPLPGGAPRKAETCHFLNAIFLFLFRELRDTALLRRWVHKKIKVELEELLLTRTAGRLLEGLSLRDVCLGDALPVFTGVRLLCPAVPPGGDEAAIAPDELAFEVQLEYNGGFHLAIDVDLVFGKSAYLFVKISRVLGRLRLAFTRLPFTHWSFCFLEDPLIDFEVKSQFEGRPMPQLTSIIVNQLKKVIKRKHTLPNYKIRYKPFFPFQVLPPTEDVEDQELSLKDMGLTEGRLKVTLIECSRLLISGSYDQELNVHCTLELGSSPWKEKSRSSIRVAELIKGTSQSVGLTFRQVQASEGDAGHVCIETVTPNSLAAAADLQRGDRIIAIGGVKVTSSVQITKLFKQAGDRVQLFYERPVGQNQPTAPLQDNFGQLEDSAFLSPSCPLSYEDDPSGHLGDGDNKELDSEFEDLAGEIKPLSDLKEEVTPPANQSPKRTPILATKPLGSISPIPNRKLNPTNLTSLKPQQKEVPKPLAPKIPETSDIAQPPARPSQGSTLKPPVPPRPQIKLTLPSSEIHCLLETVEPTTEKPERPPPPCNNVEKPAEKPAKITDQGEDLPAPKQNIVKPESVKDKVSESSCSTKDSTDDHHLWESSETAYRNRLGRWTRASCVFEVESAHKYLNVALWCRDAFKTGGLVCLGHASIKLEDIALECVATSCLEYFTTFRLNAPEPKATVSRTALRSLSVHKGFNERFCYGDVTLNFRYLIDGESEASSVLTEQERECSSPEEMSTFLREEPTPGHNFTESRHNFQDTQFQNPTWCDHCKKKVWTKAASQCLICAYVCHKKCQEKCLAENPLCISMERRVDSESKLSVNRTTGITRHIINTSYRVLNLRQVSKARAAEQGSDLVEPSPKHTPNTSDNESSDTETGSTSSPSKRANSGAKLVRKEGGLDDSVFIAVKEIGRDLYRGLPTDERFQKLEFMLDKLQCEIDQELEHNNSLLREEKETTDARKKSLLSAALSKSGERLQALTLLTIHYRAGVEDLESLESASVEQQSRKIAKSVEETSSIAEEADDTDVVSQVEPDVFNCILEEQIIDPSEPV